MHAENGSGIMLAGVARTGAHSDRCSTYFSGNTQLGSLDKGFTRFSYKVVSTCQGFASLARQKGVTMRLLQTGDAAGASTVAPALHARTAHKFIHCKCWSQKSAVPWEEAVLHVAKVRLFGLPAELLYLLHRLQLAAKALQEVEVH